MSYYYSGTLHEDDPTYVKRQADNELFEALRAAEFCYVLSSRQTGKSSLRVRTMSRLKQAGCACSVIDVSADATNEVEPKQWYANLVSTLTYEFDLDFQVGRWYRQQDWFSPLSRFREFLESVLLAQIRENIVIFIDEIDSLLSLPFPTDDFFALIRACHNKRVDNPIYKRLTFCLLGVATPSDLIRDKKRTPFNIGKGIELTRFTFEEAQGSLTPGLAQKVDNPERVLSQVLGWTGGQPFLTQKVCQLVIDNANSRQPDIERLVQTHVIDHWENQDIPEHLGTIRDRLLADERIASRKLGLYEAILHDGSISADMSEEKMQLRLSGVVAKVDEKLVPYNLIYKTIFDRHWIGEKLAELRPDEYASAFNAWISSERNDSQLLRGEAMEIALRWKEGRSLCAQDQDFIVRSQELDRQDKQKANLILEAANRTARKRILLGSVVLGIASVAAVAATLQAGHALRQLNETDKKLRESNEKLQLAEGKVQQKEAEARDAQAKAETANEQLAETQVSLSQTTQDLELSQSNLNRTNQQLASTQTQLTNTEQQRQQAEVARQQAQQEFAIAEEKRKEAQQREQLARSAEERANRDRERAEEETRLARVESMEAENAKREAEAGLVVAQEGTRLEREGGRILEQVRSIENGSKIRQLEVLLTAIRMGRELKTLSQDGERLTDYPTFAPINALQQILDRIREKNRLNVSHLMEVAMSSDGQYIATLHPVRNLFLWDKNGNEVARWEVSSRVNDMSFTPDGREIATGGDDGAIQFWNLNGELVRELNVGADNAKVISFTPDGQQLFAGGEDGTIRLLNPNGELAREWRGTHQQTDRRNRWSRGLTDISFSSSAREVVVGRRDGTIQFWTLNGELVREWNVGARNAEIVRFSLDGQQLFSGGDSGTIQLWSLDGELLEEWHSSGVIKAIGLTDFDSNGPQVISTSSFLQVSLEWFPRKASVKPWISPNNTSEEIDPRLKNFTHAGFRRDGQQIAMGYEDGTIRLWNKNGEVVREWSVRERATERTSQRTPERITYLRFSPNGQYLFGHVGSNILMWNRHGNLLKEWGNSSIHDISLSPDGEQIAAVSNRGSFRDVDIVSLLNFNGETIQEWSLRNRVTDVSFHPNGREIATGGGDGTIQLWNLRGELVREWNIGAGAVQNISFSTDGRQIATSSSGTIQLWNRNGKLIRELKTEQNSIESLSFIADDRQIAMVYPDETLWLWRIEDLDELLARGCDWLRDYLTSNPNARDEDRQLCGISRPF